MNNDFLFPMDRIDKKVNCRDSISWDKFSNVTSLSSGTNSNIFIADLFDVKVVIKMIKQDLECSELVRKEFDIEYWMLSRVSHPNIIKVIGSGELPRKFIVLEYLSGGTLKRLLQERPGKSLLNMFANTGISLVDVLEYAKSLASALDHLHREVCLGATVIHRDLKPDNIGFSADGRLKLFDFGLVTCVPSRSHESQAYQLTGYTGSLRYMAPEVALSECYNEKVDVYSFAIVVWQMAANKVPFEGFGKVAFMQEVVVDHLRPPMSRSWPPEFSQLLDSCWRRTPEERPSFESILLAIDQLLQQTAAHKSKCI